jgi:hypothetical protein
MSDNEPTADKPTAEQPAAASEAAPVVPAAAPAQVEPARPRLRDHLFGLRSVVAVALAGVVLGGLGGFAVHAATDGGGRDDRMGRFGPGGFQGGPGRGGPLGFPQSPGQQGPGQQAPQVPQAPQPSETPSQDS